MKIISDTIEGGKRVVRAVYTDDEKAAITKNRKTLAELEATRAERLKAILAKKEA